MIGSKVVNLGLGNNSVSQKNWKPDSGIDLQIENYVKSKIHQCFGKKKPNKDIYTPLKKY